MQSKLFKRGQINTSLKERWFVLNEDTLQLHYHDIEQSELIASIALTQVYGIHTSLNTGITSTFVVLNCNNTTGKKYTFKLITFKRTYVLATNHKNICTKWVNVLSMCIFGGVIHDGVLRKSGRYAKTWKTRYCVLNKYKQIKYYPSKKRVQLLGTIDINGAVVITDDNKSYKLELEHIFEIATVKRTWKLCAPTKLEKHQWIQHIKYLLEDETNNNKRESQNSNSDSEIYSEGVESTQHAHIHKYQNRESIRLRLSETKYTEDMKDEPVSNTNWIARVHSINNQNQLLFKNSVNGDFTIQKPTEFTDPDLRWIATLAPNKNDYQYRNIQTQEIQWNAPKCFDINVQNPPPFNPDTISPTAPIMELEPGMMMKQPTVMRQREELKELRRERESLLMQNEKLKDEAMNIKATYYAKEHENENLKKKAKRKEIENRKLKVQNKRIARKKERVMKQAEEIKKELQEKEKEKKELLDTVGVNVVWKSKDIHNDILVAYHKKMSDIIEGLKIGQTYTYINYHTYIIKKTTTNTATQRNTKTNVLQQVQRSIEKGKYKKIWQWKDNDSHWNNYDKNRCKSIDKLRAGYSYKYKCSGNLQSYIIRKKTKNTAKQTNSSTNATREVRRIMEFVQMSKAYSSKVKYPNWWTIALKGKKSEYGRVKLVALNIYNHPTAKKVIEAFIETVSNKEIIKIESVENQMLFDKYWNERKTMRKLIGVNKVNEQWLFHGTGKEDVMKVITKEGFRKEFNSTAMYGKGTYFARDASYSVGYASKDKYGICKMFQCVVICGESIPGKREYDLRSWPKKDSNGLIYDTLVDHMKNPSIYVIHENARSYPMFVIHFMDKKNNTDSNWNF